MHKRFGYVIAVFVLILAGAGTWFFLTVGERKSPVVAVPANVDVIGHGKVLVVTFSDSGRGLGRTEIVITQDNQPHTVSAVDDPESGVLSREVSATVDAAALKLHDGPASLTLSAVDRSLWKNRVVKTLPVTIDLLPPQIFQINNQNHINPGGSCVVAAITASIRPLLRTTQPWKAGSGSHSSRLRQSMWACCWVVRRNSRATSRKSFA